MISIEDVTDAENAQQKPECLHGAQAAETAEACDQQAAPAVESPQTDANAEDEKQVSGSSEEDTLNLIAEAEKCKESGNALYKQKEYDAAAEKYADGLLLAPEGQKIRAVLFANRAACYLELQQFQEAVKDCSSAIDTDGEYLKAWHRRSKAYEGLDDMDRALRDVQKVQELHPDDPVAQKSISRLQPIVAERQEKMKDEMLGKLKELGNTVLGKFGMSLDNFKADKDPQTGSYSINFKQ
ncbi:hypothetical protein ABBQ32_002222 [Trebouxia sp. C0010 RCD-2024]